MLPSTVTATATRLVADCDQLPPEVHAHLLDVTALTEAERQAVINSLTGEPAVRLLCTALLSDWDRLDLPERIGMLLALAEACLVGVEGGALGVGGVPVAAGRR